MNKIKIAIIGAGGHAKSCLDLISNIKSYDFKFFVDNAKVNMKFKVINEKDFFKLKKKIMLINGVGQIKSSKVRKKIFEIFLKKKYHFPNIISKNSHVSKFCKLGKGVQIFHNCIVNALSEIGDNCIINNGSIIEHDVRIEKNCHICTGVIINGNSVVGEGTFIGSGSIVHNNITIGKNCIISAGSVIKKNIANNKFYHE